MCPQGHRLTRISQETRERAEGRTVEVRTYRCPKEHCQQCPLARRCTSGERDEQSERNEHEDLIVAAPGEDADARGQGDLPQAGPDGGTAVRRCQGPPGSASVQWSGSGACADRGGTLCAGAQSLGCPGRRPAKSRRWTKWNVLPGRSLKAGRSPETRGIIQERLSLYTRSGQTTGLGTLSGRSRIPAEEVADTFPYCSFDGGGNASSLNVKGHGGMKLQQDAY